MELRDHKRAERVPVQLVVRVILGGNPYRASLVNLSLTGGFLELDADLPPGTRMEIHLPLPGGEPMVIGASVARQGTCCKPVYDRGLDDLIVSVQGAGLIFDELDDQDALRLQDYLDLVVERL